MPARPVVSSGRRRLLLGGAIFLLASMAAGGLLAAKILEPFKQVAVREGKGDAHKAQIVIREQYNALQIIPQTGSAGHPSVGAALASTQPAPTPAAQSAIPHPAAPSSAQLVAATGRLPAAPQPAASPAPLAPHEVAEANGKAAAMLAAPHQQHPVPVARGTMHVAARPTHPPVVIEQAAPSGSTRPSNPSVRQVPAGTLAHHRPSIARQTLRLASIPVLSLDRPADQAQRATVPPRKITAHPAAVAARGPAHAATPPHSQPAAPHAKLVARATPRVPQLSATGGKGMPKYHVKRDEGTAALHPADTAARRKAAASRQVHPQALHIRPVRPVLADRGDAELPRHQRYADRLPADEGDEMDDDGPPPGYYAPPPRYYGPPPGYYSPPGYPGYIYRPPLPNYPGW